tara:strand:- start:275 stop:1678 length:1404 start_codon:yes stop_codon:yes gene_type:complete
MSSSKIITDPEQVTGVTSVEGSFSVNFDDDGNISSMVEHVGDKRTALDPNSSKFQGLLLTNAVNDARNVAKFGTNTDAYEELSGSRLITGVPSQTAEQLEDNFTTLKKKLDNEEQLAIENANKDQSIASAFASYGYGQNRRNIAGGSSPDSAVGGGILAYPLDIDTDQDHMKITRYEYFRPPDINNPQNRADYFSKKTSGPGGKDLLSTSNREGSIILPMPKVVDTNGAEWGESKVNVFGLAVGELAAAAGLGEIGSKKFSKFNAKGAAKQIEKDARKALDKREDLDLGGKKGSFGDGAQLLMASAVTGVANAAGANISQNEFLARTGGRVLNPNAELLFEGPVLRDFNFDFTMIARSRDEGDEIRKIIRFLKVGMAPRYQNQVFLRTPKIFKLEYKRGNRDLNTVNRFNPSGLALRTLAVDYAPNGYWSAYQDSQPIALRMSLNFAELKPIYDDDQESSPTGSVGY